MMIQHNLSLLAILLLVVRVRWAFRQAEMKSNLKISGKKKEVMVGTMTEEWEKKAVGRAKTGGERLSKAISFWD